MNDDEKETGLNYVLRIRRHHLTGTYDVSLYDGNRVYTGLVYFRVEVIPQLFRCFGHRTYAIAVAISYHVILERRFARALALQPLSEEDRTYFDRINNEILNEYRLTD